MAPSPTATSAAIAEAFLAGNYEVVLSLVEVLPQPHDDQIRVYHLQSLVELSRYQDAVDRFALVDAPCVDEVCAFAWALHKTGKTAETDIVIATMLREYPDRARPYWIAALVQWGDQPEYLLDEERKKRIRDLLKGTMAASDCWPGIYREYASLLGYDDAAKAEAVEVRCQAHERWPSDLLLRAEYGEVVFVTNPEVGSEILAPILTAGRSADVSAQLIARSCHIELAVSDERYVDALEHLQLLVPSVASIDNIYFAQIALLAGDYTVAAELLAAIPEPSDETEKIRYFYTTAAITLQQGLTEDAVRYCRQAHAYVDSHDPLDMSCPVRLESGGARRFLEPIDSAVVAAMYQALRAREASDMADVLAYLECHQCVFSDQERRINWALMADARLPIEYVKRTLFRHCLTKGEYKEALRYGLEAFLVAFEKGKALEDVYLHSENSNGEDLASGLRREHFQGLLDQCLSLCRQKRKQPIRGFYRQYLRNWLIGAESYDAMIQLFRMLNGSRTRDVSVGDLFDLALAYQRSGNEAEAEKYYRMVIAKKKPGQGVFFNLSLILENRGEIEAAASILERAQPFEEEKYATRYQKLCEIRDRRQDLRRFSIVYDTDRPPASIDISPLSFRDLLYLLAVTYALQSPNREELVPEVNANAQITPHSAFTKELFSHLIDRGLLYIDPSTPRESYRIEANGSLTYYLNKVKWRLNVLDQSLSVRQLMPYLENACRERAKASSEEMEAVRQTLILWEALGYLQLRMDAYGYQYSVTDKTVATFREVTSHFSVSRAWNIIFQSLESAAAKQLEKQLSRPHAANLAVAFCRSRANKAMEEGWRLKPYDRPKEFPESAITHAWCYMANVNVIDFLNHACSVESSGATV